MTEPPKFIDTDVSNLEKEVISELEKKLNKTFQPGQLERLYCEYLAYRESLINIRIQKAALLNLINYSHCPILNEIGEMFDCPQLMEQYSKATAELGLNEIRDYDIIIPAGTQIETKDKKFIFLTDNDAIIPSGQISTEVGLTCLNSGSGANGYLPGEINSLLPLSNIDYSKNITTSSGGADIEDEESYKSRIKIALNKVSCAGSKSAYIYFTKSAHQDIIDVQVESPELPASIKLNGQTFVATNGIISNDLFDATINYITGKIHLSFKETVNELDLTLPPDSLVRVYPLTKDATLSDVIKKAVEDNLNAEKVRPLTDKVEVLRPEGIDIKIEAVVTFYKKADKDKAKKEIESNINEYILKMKRNLAKSIVPSEITTLIQSVEGVYRVELIKPQYRELELHQFANITASLSYNEDTI